MMCATSNTPPIAERWAMLSGMEKLVQPSHVSNAAIAMSEMMIASRFH